MARVLTTALIGILLIGVGGSPAAAQSVQVCGERTDVVNSLAKRYEEKRVSMGLAGNGAVLEVYASKAGTFTIVMTHPSGTSCMIAAGEDWEEVGPTEKAGHGI